MSKPQPIQPIVIDKSGTVRFRENAIVRWLLDNGGKNLNDIAGQMFDREDREQFAQLIGYSLNGASELSYMSDAVLNIANARASALRDNPDADASGDDKADASYVRGHEEGFASALTRVRTSLDEIEDDPTGVG